jgi:pantetheine-phosphate adenylyltransferase
MKKVVVGGTFDSLHKGHRHFLEKAASLGRVKIGLTSDEMALETKGEKVESFEERSKHLLSFLNDVEIEKIDNSIGFAVNEDFDYIVVSSETRTRAEKINQERESLGKEKIEIVEVEFILAEDGEPISSTRIRAGEIDKEGKLIK